jgi:hypothetical protein
MPFDPTRQDEPPRCRHTWRDGPQCCREAGHDGEHRFRCASPGCPGRPFPASEMRHPYLCGEPR